MTEANAQTETNQPATPPDLTNLPDYYTPGNVLDQHIADLRREEVEIENQVGEMQEFCRELLKQLGKVHQKRLELEYVKEKVAAAMPAAS